MKICPPQPLKTKGQGTNYRTQKQMWTMNSVSSQKMYCVWRKKKYFVRYARTKLNKTKQKTIAKNYHRYPFWIRHLKNCARTRKMNYKLELKNQKRQETNSVGYLFSKKYFTFEQEDFFFPFLSFLNCLKACLKITAVNSFFNHLFNQPVSRSRNEWPLFCLKTKGQILQLHIYPSKVCPQPLKFDPLWLPSVTSPNWIIHYSLPRLCTPACMLFFSFRMLSSLFLWSNLIHMI